MSLSRPVKFPLLKLPLLCIECVIRSCNSFNIIFLALTSKRTRQIVNHVKPLNRIGVFVSETKRIVFGRNVWHFRGTSSQSVFDEHQNLRKMPLVLQNNAIPLYTCETGYGLETYTDGNGFIALKMVMEFLNEIFKCQVENVVIKGGNYPESGDIGVKSAVNLCIDHTFRHTQCGKLRLLLENLEVTGTCTFWIMYTDNGFYLDPKIFKCKKLVFWSGSSTWITREILLQFEVPQLSFNDCPFSMEDIVPFVTEWFHSDNRKFEYLYIHARNRQFSLATFRTGSLNPSPFSGRNCVPSSESFGIIDFSEGLELRRNDGLAATIHVNRRSFLFYIWHNQ